MNNFLHFQNFKHAAGFIILFIVSAVIFAQSPQYYNYNTGGGPNAYPLNVAAGKMVQWLVAPCEFNQPTGARNGLITNFYCYIATGFPLAPYTYSSFNLIFYQTTNSSLTSGSFYTGNGDTVYKRTSVTLQAAANTWLKFTLDHPFVYDSTKSLVIQMEQCGAPGAAGYSLAHTTVSGTRRVWSVGTCPYTPYASGGTNVLNCGIDILIPPAVPNFFNTNAGTSNNIFPFAVIGGKEVQWLIRSGDFIQPAPAPSGYITSLYFWMGGVSTNVLTYLCVKLGQTTLTNLPTGVIYTGHLDTVYFKPSVFLSSTTSSWMVINLDRVFYYDSTKSLVIDISQCGATSTSMYVHQLTGSGVIRSYINGTTSCVFTYSGQDAQIINAGVYLATLTGSNREINNRVPTVYSLSQNYPNPFNPYTTIKFAVPKAGNIQLKVYDELGKETAVLMNEYKKAGEYSVKFDGTNLASGVYFYKIFAGEFTDTKKMMLIK